MRDDFLAPPDESFTAYLARRRQVFAVVYLGYAGAYLVRNNVKVFSDLLAEERGWSAQEVGYVLTGFTLTYGLAKLVMGIAVDRGSERRIFALCLAAAAVCCAIMAGLGSVAAMVAAMAVIGVFQGALAPAALTTIGAWYPNAMRGSRVAIWNTSQNVGAGLLPVIGAAGFALFGVHDWRIAFWLPGLIVLLGAAWIYRVGADRPWQEGFPTLTEMYGAAGVPRLQHTNQGSYWRMIRVHVLTNRLLVTVGVINALLYLARFGVLNWMPIYLARDHGFTLGQTSTAMVFFEWGALPGALAFAALAWRWPNRTATAAAGGTVLLAAVIWLYAGTVEFDAILIIALVLGALTYGPQVTVNILTLNFVSPRATGLAVGFVGLGGYLVGEIAANLAMPAIAEQIGWSAGFTLLSVTSLVAAALYGTLRDAERRVVLLSE